MTKVGHKILKDIEIRNVWMQQDTNRRKISCKDIFVAVLASSSLNTRQCQLTIFALLIIRSSYCILQYCNCTALLT